MTKLRFSHLLFLFLIGCSLALVAPAMWGGSEALAQTQAEQIREAGNLVRSAERHFHGGRFEEARKELDKAEQLLKAAAAQGESPQLNTAQSRYDRLSRSVNQRIEAAAPAEPARAEPSPAPAAASADLVREAGNLIRSAERHLHSGRLEEARQELDKAEQALKAAAAEGESPQLSSAQTRYDRLSQNLARRMEEPAAAAAAPSAPAPQAARLPGGAARSLRELNREVSQAHSNLSHHRWWDIPASVRESRIKAASDSIDSYRERLDEVLASLDPSFHEAPEVQEIQTRLAELPDLIEKRSTETEPEEEITPAAAEARALVEKIQEFHSAFNAQFRDVHGNSMIYGTSPEDQLEQGKKALAQLEALERDALPLLRPVLGEVADTLGQTPADINNALHRMGVKTDFDAGRRFDDLYRGLGNVQKSRQASAQELAMHAGRTISLIESLSEEIRLDRLETARKFLALAQAFDSADQEVNRLLGEAETLYGEMSVRIEGAIDARTWAGNQSDFPGPGSTADLSRAALDFIRKHPNWNPSGRGTEILAVSVQGPWDVGTRDLLGRVLQWRLPVHVAITNNDMKKDNIARVYELSVLTQEGAPGNQDKKPPFVEYWVGNSWNMRINNVPAQR